MRYILGQTALLTFAGLKDLGKRRGSAVVAVISIAAVVGVLISLLAVREGTSIFRPNSAQVDEAIVLSRGAANVSQSSLSRENVEAIMEAPGVKKSADGHPYAYASTLVSVDALRRDGKRGAVNLAGYGDGWQRVGGGVNVVAGRLYRPAVRELMVSEPVRKMFRGFDLGDQVTLHGSRWTIVGVFTSNDSQTDSLLLADAETVMSAFGRNSFGQVNVWLESPAAFTIFTDALAHNPAMSVEVRTVAEEFEQSFGQMRRLLTFIAYFIGGVMACGGICGALNSLYSSVDSRRREIATLRAIGFSAAPIVASILVESTLLALPGAFFGAFVASLLFNGNLVNSSGLIFKLSVTPHVLVVGIVWALVIGLIGGSLPALRASRLPVAAALRVS